MRLFITIIILSIFHTLSIGQIASYSFDTDLSDSVAGNDAMFFGTTSFLTDGNAQVLQFEGDEYAVLPDTVHESVIPNESFGYHVRFKITDDHITNPFNGETGDGRRVIISNRIHDLRAKGFDLYFGRYFDNETFSLIATYGAGVVENENGDETKVDILLDATAPLNEWIDITVKFYLNGSDPYILYLFDNVAITSYFHPEFTVDSLKNSLYTQEINLGTDEENDLSYWLAPFAQMNVDQVDIYSPIPPGDSDLVQTALASFIDKMEGNASFTPAEENQLLLDFLSNWEFNTFQANESLVYDYLATYDRHRGTVFNVNDFDVYQPNSFEPEKNIQYTIELWILDNLYGAGNILNMEGISFLDNEVFPGPVSASAPRLQGINLTIDGDYNSNPGFHLNSEESVIRPTGYYAAPGEKVTITVPPSMIEQDIKIRVGAHNNNLAAQNQSFNRFPRVSKDFEIEHTTIDVINPFGGAIYFVFPDGSNFGPVTLTINGAVKTPYYCNKTGFENSLADFIVDVSNNYTGWVEFESAKFMSTFPRPENYDFSSIEVAMDNWDKGMDAFNIVSGRPLERFRSEYLLMDRQNWAGFTVAPATNPMFFLAQYGAPIPIPCRMEDPNAFHEDNIPEVVFHELGHLHNMPTLWEEVEANVHIPKVAAYHLFFGDDLEEAFRYAGPQRYTRDQAAIDWLLTHPFRLGLRNGWDPYNIPGNLNQYQSRGFARNVEIAALYGWDTLGNINNHYYQEGLTNPAYDPYNIDDDDFILVSSQKTNKNLAPLFELWGILPSDDLVRQLDRFESDTIIRDRILHYRSIIPQDLGALQTFHQSLVDVNDMYWWDTWEGQRYQNMLGFYNETVADSIHVRIDEILCRYFDTNCTLALPVELLTFSGKPIQKSVQLDWTTASELNNEGFEIQKSLDGRNWTKLDFVKGIGTTNQQSTYTYLDLNPFLGVNYYRLKQIDRDGSFEYSNSLAVTFKKSEVEITIFPNPVNDLLTIDGLTNHSIRIFNPLGKLLEDLSSEENVAIDFSKFSSGLYIIEIRNNINQEIQISNIIKH